MSDLSDRRQKADAGRWDRFMRFVEVDAAGCWRWAGLLDKDGYACFQYSRERGKVRAHRFAYEHSVGPIPEGLHLDHLCCVRDCVNPAHLEPVSPAENIARCANHPGRRTHCPGGHPYSGDNLKINVYGRRVCRACANAQARARRKRSAAA